jgi:hypothetical protein
VTQRPAAEPLDPLLAMLLRLARLYAAADEPALQLVSAACREVLAAEPRTRTPKSLRAALAGAVCDRGRACPPGRPDLRLPDSQRLPRPRTGAGYGLRAGPDPHDAVRSSVAAMGADQAAVLVLRDVEGWPAGEACAALRLAEPRQRILLRQAREQVRHALVQAGLDRVAGGAPAATAAPR